MDEKIIICGVKKGITDTDVVVLLMSMISLLVPYIIDIEIALTIFPIWIVAFLPYVLCRLLVGNCEIVVTNKRVYGKARFRSRVDLPIDIISAVSTNGFGNVISVSTASGNITFTGIKNKDEIHAEITRLLLARNTYSMGAVYNVQTPAPIDEMQKLRNFKALLDEGIITQEEFETKKKELLGL